MKRHYDGEFESQRSVRPYIQPPYRVQPTMYSYPYSSESDDGELENPPNDEKPSDEILDETELDNEIFGGRPMPFRCVDCPQEFWTAHDLAYHIHIHRGWNSHICNVCERDCGNLSTLTIHMRSHSEERPFVCNGCGTAFKTTGNLKTHRERHKLKDMRVGE